MEGKGDLNLIVGVMEKLLKIIIVINYLCSQVEGDVDWCSNEYDCYGQKNTMCIYQPRAADPNCEDLKDAQTPDSRQIMLDLHNQYRNKLAGGEMPGWPKAANMRQMSWDNEIESIALRWAVQCIPGHDSCRRTQRFEALGQNYGMNSHTIEYPESKGCFDLWVNEIQSVSQPNWILQNYQGGIWGHLTQIIWATSYMLGCANIHYIRQGFKTTVVICNYGPAGNILTMPIYEVGEPASRCPEGTRQSQKYPNLCASPDDGDVVAGGGYSDGYGGGAKNSTGGGNSLKGYPFELKRTIFTASFIPWTLSYVIC